MNTFQSQRQPPTQQLSSFGMYNYQSQIQQGIQRMGTGQFEQKQQPYQNQDINLLRTMPPSNPSSQQFVSYNSQSSIQGNKNFQMNINSSPFQGNVTPQTNMQPINLNQSNNPSQGYTNTPKNNNFGAMPQIFSNTSIQTNTPLNRQPLQQQQSPYTSSVPPPQMYQPSNFSSSLQRDNNFNSNIGMNNSNSTPSHFQRNMIQTQAQAQPFSNPIYPQQSSQFSKYQGNANKDIPPNGIQQKKIQPIITVNNKQQRSHSRENDSVRFSENTKYQDLEDFEVVNSPQYINTAGSFQGGNMQQSMFRKAQQRNLSEGANNNLNSPDVTNLSMVSSKLRRQKSFYKYNKDMLPDATDSKTLNYQFIHKLGDKDEQTQTIFGQNNQNRWISKNPKSKQVQKLENLLQLIETKYGISQKDGCINILTKYTNPSDLKVNLSERMKAQIMLIKQLELVVNETSLSYSKQLLEIIESQKTKKEKIKKLATDGRIDLDLEGQLKEIHQNQLENLCKLQLIEYKYDCVEFNGTKQTEEDEQLKTQESQLSYQKKTTSELLLRRLADAMDQCETARSIISQVQDKDIDRTFIRQSTISKTQKSQQDNLRSQLVIDIPLDQVLKDAVHLMSQSLPNLRKAWDILCQEEQDTQSLLIDIQAGLFNLKQCTIYKQIKYEPLKKIMLKYLCVVFLDIRLPMRKNNEYNIQVFDSFIKILQDMQEDITFYLNLIDRTTKGEQNYYYSYTVNEELTKQKQFLEFLQSYSKNSIQSMEELKKRLSDTVHPMDIMSKHKSTIDSMNHPNVSQKEIEYIFELYKGSIDLQQQVEQSLIQIDQNKIKSICSELDLPYDHFLTVLSDQIQKEIKSSQQSLKSIESYVLKYRYVESDVDESIKILQNQGLNLQKQWESVDEGKSKLQLEDLEAFYKQLKETLENIGAHIYDSQVRCNMSSMNFKKAKKIYISLKAIHKKVLRNLFLQKEIHLIDLKAFQGLVSSLDLTDTKSEAEFKKFCNMIQGIQTMVSIEQDNADFKQVLESNQGFFQLVDLYMKKHETFKNAYEKVQDLAKLGSEYGFEPFNDSLRSICMSDRNLQKSINIITSFSQEFHKRCIEQINKKAIEQNITQKNQLIDQLTIYKNDIYARIEKFYLFIFETEQTFEIVGGIENVYQTNKIDFLKFQDQIKTLQRKFKTQPLHFQLLDGYHLEAQQNILLTKYFIGLNNFLINQSNNLIKTILPSMKQSKYNNSDDFVSQIQSLYTYNAESKIEIYLKKRKNINIEIYHRFETIARCYYQFFEYALECNRIRLAFTECFENCKAIIDLGDQNFIQNVNQCLDLSTNFDKRMEAFITEMKNSKLNSFYLFSNRIIEKLKNLVTISLQNIDIKFLTKLQTIMQSDKYKECHMNYTTAYQEVKSYIQKQQRKKQIKEFLDDLHSVYLPKVRMSLANSLINRENFYQFLPELKNTEMFKEIKFINDNFQLHKHKNCEAFFNSLYDVVHLYVQQKQNLREQKDLIGKVSDLFQKHNQNFQMNLQRELSNIFQSIIRDDYDLSRNFKN
ncbi:hypothetical protein ABPG74_022700 [Tetrahymena malaccensis]